ncbi:MAG: HEAT repeat domain-containing protein [Planctomycetota bacterium]|nr:HEAT repeat domain-containing protein [Planctomycetota bacterium]
MSDNPAESFDAKRRALWWKRFLDMRPRVRTMLMIIALCAVCFGSWKLHDAYGEPRRAMRSHHLRVLGEGGATERRLALEGLDAENDGSDRRLFPAILTATFDEDARVRAVAASALVRATSRGIALEQEKFASEVGAATNAIFTLLEDADPEVRFAAAEALGNFGLPNDLKEFGPAAEVVLPRLTAIAERDPEVKVRAAALRSIGAWASPEREAPAALYRALRRGNPSEIRKAALGSLAMPFSEALTWFDELRVIDALVAAVDAKDPELSAAIGYRLQRVGSLPDAALPVAIEMLKTNNTVLQAVFTPIAGRFGPRAREAVPILDALARVEISEKLQSGVACAALVAVAPDSPEAQALLEPLVELAGSESNGFSFVGAASILELYGAHAAAALPALKRPRRRESSEIDPVPALIKDIEASLAKQQGATK